MSLACRRWLACSVSTNAKDFSTSLLIKLAVITWLHRRTSREISPYSPSVLLFFPLVVVVVVVVVTIFDDDGNMNFPKQRSFMREMQMSPGGANVIPLEAFNIADSFRRSPTFLSNSARNPDLALLR